MNQKVVEICYDLAAIPGVNPSNPLDPRALRFRDAAMAHVAGAVAEIAAPAGADARFDEVSFRFVVEDFDAAERALMVAVTGTRFAGFREILRYWDDGVAAA